MIKVIVLHFTNLCMYSNLFYFTESEEFERYADFISFVTFPTVTTVWTTSWWADLFSRSALQH